MKSGVWNIAFGLMAVAAGASGRFHLPFTEGPIPLMIAGGVVAAFGLYQVFRAR